MQTLANVVDVIKAVSIHIQAVLYKQENIKHNMFVPETEQFDALFLCHFVYINLL